MAISDRYEGLEQVQRTPTGHIHRARHIVLGRPVLIRTLDTERLDEEAIAAIRDAVCRTGALVHPNILSVIDAEFDGEFYYVTDVVTHSLKTRIAEAPFEVDTVARWGLQLLRAIGHAHQHGVIHRGLSPWRVHFDQVGTILVADFGLSTALKDRATGMVTFEADATDYLPMSVVRNPATYDERADRYGVGALIVRLLTGSPPDSPQVETASARGPVPDAVVESLVRLLSGRATASDLDEACAAFKAWVDALGPGVRPSDAEDAGEGAPKKRKQGASKSNRAVAADAGSGASEEPPTVAVAVPAESPNEEASEPTPSAAPAADADRVKDKLDRYANLFAD